MEIQISQELYYALKGIMVIGLLGLISVVGLIINAIIQVTRDIKNNEMYSGGDIIGIGDDTINPDTSTEKKITTNTNK